MSEPITYMLSYGATKLALTLSDDRFVSKAPMQNVDIPLSSLRHFCLGPASSGAGNYDSQLIVSWDEAGKAKSKKIYVRQTDVSFQQLLAALQQKRPEASLLHLDAKAAQKQMGVTSTNKLVWIIGLAIVAAIVLVVVLLGVLSGAES
jgi:hypothetical protein